MNAAEILADILRGEFISRFSVGDTWTLYIGSYALVAQDIVSEDEMMLNKWLKYNYPPYQKSIDQEYISKSAIVAAHMRKEILGLQLDQLCNLTLEFEGDSKLIIPATLDVVDWQ